MEREEPEVDHRSVFVVYGRNDGARQAMFAFLRALGLSPMEWSQAVKLTGSGAPFIGEVLHTAFGAAQAVVVLLTPDEVAYLRTEYAGENDPEVDAAPQARPNVLFEAGMAFGRHPERTILVELGEVRPFSDVAGRHLIRLSNEAADRTELAQRLTTAGCDVDTSGTDWLSAGDFTPPPPPGHGLPMGKRLAKAPNDTVRVSARYVDRGKGSGTLQITNHCGFPISNLTVELPEEAGDAFHLINAEPIKRLPPGETASYHASRFMAPGADHFELIVHGEHSDGAEIETTAFVNLVG